MHIPQTPAEHEYPPESSDPADRLDLADPTDRADDTDRADSADPRLLFRSEGLWRGAYGGGGRGGMGACEIARGTEMAKCPEIVHGSR